MAKAQSDRKCYFPEGNLAETNVPCTDEENTSCCDYREICLSNGLCQATTNQPYTLSRGSCTNQNWRTGCPEYCSKANKRGGSSIINYSFSSNGSPAKYCCGTIISTGNDTTGCSDGQSPFEVPNATALPGFALLANVTSFNASNSSDSNTTCPLPLESSTCSGSSCHETAVGAGVGVPLGVIALASIAWAIWERRRGKKAVAAASAAAASKHPGVYDNGNGVYVERKNQGVMSELDSNRPPAELNA